MTVHPLCLPILAGCQPRAEIGECHQGHGRRSASWHRRRPSCHPAGPGGDPMSESRTARRVSGAYYRSYLLKSFISPLEARSNITHSLCFRNGGIYTAPCIPPGYLTRTCEPVCPRLRGSSVGPAHVSFRARCHSTCLRIRRLHHMRSISLI